MTIGEFSNLCGCSTPTLRYYDDHDLLKPIRVDSSSGYRYYSEEQAPVFVKIKTLQRANFTIEEIKALLNADNDAVCKALDAKIAEAEEKAEEIKKIRESYHTEMDRIHKLLKEDRDFVNKLMAQFDAQTELDISESDYGFIADNVDRILAIDPNEIDQLDPDEIERIRKEKNPEYPDYADDPNFALVYEKHGWTHIKEFLDEIPNLLKDGDYTLAFDFDKTKLANVPAIGMTLLMKLPHTQASGISYAAKESADGMNHFRLYKRIAEGSDDEPGADGNAIFSFCVKSSEDQ